MSRIRVILEIDGEQKKAIEAVIVPEEQERMTASVFFDHLTNFNMRNVEKQVIIRALKLAHYNRDKTAVMLGIGVRSLYRKIKEYDINCGVFVGRKWITTEAEPETPDLTKRS